MGEWTENKDKRAAFLLAAQQEIAHAAESHGTRYGQMDTDDFVQQTNLEILLAMANKKEDLVSGKMKLALEAATPEEAAKVAEESYAIFEMVRNIVRRASRRSARRQSLSLSSGEELDVELPPDTTVALVETLEYLFVEKIIPMGLSQTTHIAAVRGICRTCDAETLGDGQLEQVANAANVQACELQQMVSATTSSPKERKAWQRAKETIKATGAIFLVAVILSIFAKGSYNQQKAFAEHQNSRRSASQACSSEHQGNLQLACVAEHQASNC